MYDDHDRASARDTRRTGRIATLSEPAGCGRLFEHLHGRSRPWVGATAARRGWRQQCGIDDCQPGSIGTDRRRSECDRQGRKRLAKNHQLLQTRGLAGRLMIAECGFVARGHAPGCRCDASRWAAGHALVAQEGGQPRLILGLAHGCSRVGVATHSEVKAAS